MKKPVIRLIGAVLAALLAYFLYELFTTPSMRSSSEQNVGNNLRTLVTAEEHFRANDPDKNGENDFWRSDIAGLYALIPKGDAGKNPIKLIELSVAGADDRSTVDISKYANKMPKAGYWYRALRKKDEPPVKTTQFAFCAFPNTPSAGRWTFIIDERNAIFKADLGGARGIEVFPDEAELAARWSRMD